MPRNFKHHIRYGSGKKIDKVFDILAITGQTQSPPDYPGEKHVKGMNYLGPGTNIETRMNLPDSNPKKHPSKKRGPVLEKVDKAAQIHDVRYLESNKALKDGTITQSEFNDEIAMADDEFIEYLRNIRGFNLTKTIASKAILLKKFGEKVGVLPRTAFSQSGEGMRKLVDEGIFTPNHILMKKKKEIIHGGFLPALLPFLIGVVQVVGPAVVGVLTEKLIKKITDDKPKKKQSGEGFKDVNIPHKNADTDEKRKFIIQTLDKLPESEQIEFVHSAVFK